MSHYLVYWKPDTVVNQNHLPLLNHSASNQYSKVRTGDILWIVTSEEPEDLVLVGRQQVDQVVEEAEAKEILGVSDIWPAKYHAISHQPEDKLNLVISRYAFAISFDSAVRNLPEGFSGQHLQTMRRLDSSSIELLERLWRDRDDLVDRAP